MKKDSKFMRDLTILKKMIQNWGKRIEVMRKNCEGLLKNPLMSRSIRHSGNIGLAWPEEELQSES